jgi:hypothetical protein
LKLKNCEDINDELDKGCRYSAGVPTGWSSCRKVQEVGPEGGSKIAITIVTAFASTLVVALTL